MAIGQSLAKGLLGMFQPQPDQLQSLLGDAYDPRTARMKWLGGTLQGLGLGLASGEPGAWATGLTQGGGQAVDDYRKQAQQNYMLAQAKQDQDWQAKERARKESEWAQEDATSAQMNSLIGSLPENERVYAQLAPEAWVKSKINPGGDGGQYFGTPLPYALPGGGVGYGLPSRTGGFAPLPVPEGGAFLGPFEKAQQSAQGKASGDAMAAAPGDIAAADFALEKINGLRSDPNRVIGTGMSSVFNVIPGTPGYDFQNKVDEVTAGAFLTAIQQMRGLGALSNVEGQTAAQAVTRMKTATSEQAFLDAVNDYEAVVMRGKLRAENRLSGGAPNQNSGALPDNDPLGLR